MTKSIDATLNSEASVYKQAPILIVEDDASIRDLIQCVLEEVGHPVESVMDGEQALQWMQEAQPALLILDMNLPLVDGFGVAAGAQLLYGESVPILTITASNDIAEKARRVGAVAFLQKPFDIEDLINAVDWVVRPF